MAVHGRADDGDSQSPRVAQRDELRSTDVDLSEWLGIVVVACNRAGIGPEKLALEMECHKSYPSRVLRGEKPLTLPFLLRLPEGVKDAFAQLYAESRGFVVVRQVPFEVAMGNLLSGLFSVLAQRDPQTKAKMARASLPEPIAHKKVG